MQLVSRVVTVASVDGYARLSNKSMLVSFLRKCPFTCKHEIGSFFTPRFFFSCCGAGQRALWCKL